MPLMLPKPLLPSGPIEQMTGQTKLSSQWLNLRRAWGAGQKIATAAVAWAAAGLATGLLAFATGCDFTREAYCQSRAHGECRQLYEGDCFSAAERGTLVAQNFLFSPDLVKGRNTCEKAQNKLCLARTSTGDSTGYVEPDIDRALCAETIDAVACVDFKAAVVELDGIPVPGHLSVCLDAVEAENP